MDWMKIEDETFATRDGQAFLYRSITPWDDDTTWCLDIDGAKREYWYCTQNDAKTAYQLFMMTGKIEDDTNE